MHGRHRPGRLLATASLAVTASFALPPIADADTLRGKVSKVKDGDSVAVKIGSRVRTFNLSGINAPELGACYGADAKAKLGKLLHRGDRVKVIKHGGSAELFENGTSINRAMVRGGFAQATSSKFQSIQGAAQASDKGLWGACEMTPAPAPTPTPPPGPTPPPSNGHVTGQAAIDKMTAELKGGRWRQFTSGSTGSTEYILNLCADGTFLRTVEAAFGGRLYKRGTWKVTDAEILEDGTRGAQVVANVTEGDPPPDSSQYFTLLGANGDGQWFWDKEAAQYFQGAAS